MNSAVAAVLFACLPGVILAGPVEFGLAEYKAALAARGLKWKINTDLNLEPPETFQIDPYRAGGAHITGGDLRGLMYGLLEAADQIRTSGHFTQVRAVPDTAIRAVRVFAQYSDLEKYSDEFWRSYFEMLARDRFNRLTLIFLDQTPYPFLLGVDGFPGVRVPSLTVDQRERNLRKLRFISQAANDYAVDFVLGIWDNGPNPLVEGLTTANRGPYTREALRKMLTACPMIRGVQMQTDSDSVEFYRDYVVKALRATGRRVTLDPRGVLRRPEFLKVAEEAGIALQQPSDGWLGRIEIDPPFLPGQWEFENHSLLYWLWGRLTYDPQTKPPKGENPDEFRAASQIVSLLIATQRADPNMYTWPPANPGIGEHDGRPPEDWGFVASVPEAVRNRLGQVASAKQTPLETSDLLLAAASGLERPSSPDYRLIERLAKYQAHKQRAVYQLELFDQARAGESLDLAEQELKSAQAAWNTGADLRIVKERLMQRHKDAESGPSIEIPPIPPPRPRPQFSHVQLKTTVPDQPVTLMLQINPAKDVRAVRLHYRNANRKVPDQTVEQPAAASISFTIPAEGAQANWDIFYYFEILDREGGGWFEPDPVGAGGYYTIKVATPVP